MQPRHRRAVSRHGIRKPAGLGRVLGATATLAGAAILGVVLSGGTYALWTDRVPLGAGVIHSGDAGLALSVDSIDVHDLLPGEVGSEQLTITNSGTAASEVSAFLAATSPDFEVRAQIGAAVCSPTTPLAGPALGAGQAHEVSIGTLAADRSATLCVQVTALASVTPAESFAFAATVAGTQSS